MRSIVSVAFQYSPAGANTWTTFGCWGTSTPPGPSCAATKLGDSYASDFDSTAVTNGVYDFRAVATDSGVPSEISPSAVASDLIVANDANAIFVPSPGSPLSGTVTLTAKSEPVPSPPSSMTFEICPSAADCAVNGGWKRLAPVVPQLDDAGNPTATTTLDTHTLGGDGKYDVSVSAPPDDFGNPFVGGIAGNLAVDNTAPTVRLDSPGAGASLGGVTTLTASAQDAGSGVAAVKFEVAPQGTGAWQTVGVASSPPYSVERRDPPVR